MVLKKRYKSIIWRWKKIIVSTIQGSKTLLNVQEEDIYDALEEYIILPHIRMQFIILIASYSYKSQKLKGSKKEYMTHVGILLIQNVIHSRLINL